MIKCQRMNKKDNNISINRTTLYAARHAVYKISTKISLYTSIIMFNMLGVT